MTVHIVKWEPTKKAKNNGATALVLAIDAPNKKAAEGIAIGKLWEAYPAAADNFLKPEIVEDQVGCPRPAVGVFDEQFAINNEFDGEKWQERKVVEEQLIGPVDLMQQPANVRIAAVMMYGEGEIDNSQLSLVVDMLNDEDTPDDTGLRGVIDALTSVAQVGCMYPSAVFRLVSAIFEQSGDSVPAKADVLAFSQEWVSNPDEREKIKLGQYASTSTSDNIQSVPDYNTLSMHTMLSVMNTHPLAAKAADVRNAKELIEQRDSVWRAWDKSFRVIVGILDVDTDTRHAIISDGLKNLKLIDDDEARLNFVKSRLAGNPACPELANYGQQPEKQPEVQNLGGGKFSIDGLTEQPASNDAEKPEVDTQEPVSDTVASQAKETLDKLGYGVYASEPEQKSELLQRAENTLAEATELAEKLSSDDFQQRANQVEQVIAEQPQEDRDNLGIWNRVYKTDAKFTKAFSNNGGGTSINGTYMVMQATKVFGPHGINWGVEIIEERFDNGAPIMQSIKQPDGNFIKGIIPNGTGGYLCEINHTVKIRLWYKQDGQVGEVLSYGCTPYLYALKNGGMMSDGEAPKKSLTDATKKALSQLGFSADVFLGLYDDLKYVEENKAEFEVKNASDKAEDVTRIRKELDEKFKQNTESMRTAVTPNEVSGIASALTRVMAVHLNAARDKADHEYAKYLESRLRRLEDIKAECLAKLQETAS